MTTRNERFGDPDDDLHESSFSDEEIGVMLQQRDPRALVGLTKNPANGVWQRFVI